MREEAKSVIRRTKLSSTGNNTPKISSTIRGSAVFYMKKFWRAAATKDTNTSSRHFVISVSRNAPCQPWNCSTTKQSNTWRGSATALTISHSAPSQTTSLALPHTFRDDHEVEVQTLQHYAFQQMFLVSRRILCIRTSKLPLGGPVFLMIDEPHVVDLDRNDKVIKMTCTAQTSSSSSHLCKRLDQQVFIIFLFATRH